MAASIHDRPDELRLRKIRKIRWTDRGRNLYAAIPIVQGVPASVLFALTGAIITERVYVVPGAGNLLTEAISKYDNGVIVGVTLFYAVLSVISIILGDVLMSMVDPRISFSTKDR